MSGLSISIEKAGKGRRCRTGMLVVYVKLWRIDGQKQTHIAGKSFKVSKMRDISEIQAWVEEILWQQLQKEGGE